jgi:Zn-dependent peptidase ImmA (M78 family)
MMEYAMPDFEAVASRAADLLRSRNITRPPVPVEEIVKSLGISLYYQPLEPNVSGVLVRRGNSVRIGVNASHHVNRQRFTVAHELAHHVLHPDAPTVFVDGAFVHFRGEDVSDPEDVRELEANVFAASLLMPEEFLKADLKGKFIDAFDEAAMKLLANQYKVSLQALTIRLVRLGFAGGVRPWVAAAG